MNDITKLLILALASVLILIVNAYPAEYYTLAECQAYLRGDYMLIENKWEPIFDLIPEQEGQPEYVVIGNYIYTVWYESMKENLK